MKNRWQHYPLISTQLQAVNDCIHQRIVCNNPSLEAALLAMADNGGKYLRPALLLLTARACNPQSSEHDDRLVKVASSIEILHMATLIHDDIIDDSPKRRGAVSIQTRFGKDTAVYAGDLLFTVFFDLLIETMPGSSYLTTNARSMRQILNGELGQMGQRFNTQQGLKDYLKNVNGKTAALFRLAAREGAHFGGGDERLTRPAAKFGQNLGIAFQMLDDILDYTGGQGLNKPVLEDLATGVYSLPLLLALQQPSAATQLGLLLAKKRQMTLADMQRVQEIVVASDAVKASRQLAGRFTNKAIENLTKLPDNRARRFLHQMANQLLKRTM